MYYYKNKASDASNVISGIEKVLLDGLQEIGLVTNDNVQFHLGSSWSVGGEDKLMPRVQITIRGVE